VVNINQVICQIKNKFRVVRFKDYFILLFGLILIIVLFILILLIKKPKTIKPSVSNEYKNETPTLIPTTDNKLTKEIEKDKFELPASVNPEIVNILGKVYSIFSASDDKSSIKGSISVGNYGTVCDSENGEEMCEAESPSVRWLIRAMDVKKSLNAVFNDSELEKIKKDKINLLSLIKEEFTKNNFISDKVSLGDYDSEFIENYYLFSKNDIRCDISSEILSAKYTAIGVDCSDQYKKNYQYKVKLIDDLGSELSEHAKARPLGEATLFDRYGIFTFIGRGTYFQVVGMMDANDKWHILWQGFDGDGIPCEVLEKYPIIKENNSTHYCYYKDGSYLEWN
jgi:hypothetical protein